MAARDLHSTRFFSEGSRDEQTGDHPLSEGNSHLLNIGLGRTPESPDLCVLRRVTVNVSRRLRVHFMKRGCG